MLAKNTEAETGTNWLQATINDVLDLQRKLVDSPHTDRQQSTSKAAL